MASAVSFFKGAYCKYNIKKFKRILRLTTLRFKILNEWESRFWNHNKKVRIYDMRNSESNQYDNNQYEN